jgi:hypothetical protein
MELYFIIGAAIGAGFGYYIGYTRCQAVMINELSEMIVEQIIPLKYEVEDNQHYFYYTDDKSFASQGSTLTEAAKNFSLNNKGMVGRVIESPTGAEFFIVDGEIEGKTE